MTYEEFKRELYRNLRMQDMSQGRAVLLLEKGSIFADKDTMAIIRLINMGNYGREDLVLREDIVCVVWRKNGIHKLLHWGVRAIYERFKREGWQGILPEMVSKLQRLGRGAGDTAANSYASESERLIVRPLHYPSEGEEAEDGICWIYGEIALTLYFLACDGEEELLTVRMNRDMIAKWDVTDEWLLTNALLNTYAKMPPRLYYGKANPARYGKEDGVFMPGEKGRGIVVHPDNPREGLRGYRVTTSKRINGAVALFYPGVKERLAELLDGDYYVGFPSIHEAMVYPARHKALGELKVAIQRNNVVLNQREMLTNRVYRYSCSRNELIEV